MKDCGEDREERKEYGNAENTERENASHTFAHTIAHTHRARGRERER